MKSGLLLLALVVFGAVAFARFADVPLEDPLWWITNQTPPTVTIDGPAGPLRGPVEARLSVAPAGRTRVVSVRVDDQVRSGADGRIALDTASLGDGSHRVEVVVHDTSRRQNLSSAVWSFVSDNTPPRLEVSLDPERNLGSGRPADCRMGDKLPGLTERW